MENQGFISTGQRNEFPIPEDFLILDDLSGLVKFEIVRHIQFFAKSEEVALGKLREFFTDKAIELYEHDGFIKKIDK